MWQRQYPLYRHPCMQALAAASRDGLAPHIRACSGRHALQLSAFADDPPPRSPLLPHWVCLQVAAHGCSGELIISTDADLPFADESFDVIWLKLALEVSAQPSRLLAMAIRVLAPGGQLLISGLHPCSGWALWRRLQGAGGGRLQPPWLLQLALGLSGLSRRGYGRYGGLWPGAQPDLETPGVLGGVYLLQACKAPRRILPFARRRPVDRRASGLPSAIRAVRGVAAPDVAVTHPGSEACTLPVHDPLPDAYGESAVAASSLLSLKVVA